MSFLEVTYHFEVGTRSVTQRKARVSESKLSVKEMLPVDQAKKNADLPQFLAQYQHERQGEAFNLWLRAESNRELHDTPLFKKPPTGAAPQL